MSAEIQKRLKTLTATLRRAAKHPHDAEAIHKMRVAIRRFSQVLRVFQDSFEHRHVRKMRRRLRKLMDLCGAARNCDIALEVLEAAGVPAEKSLEQRLRRVRSRAERELVKRLADPDTRADLHRWRTWSRPAKASAAPQRDVLRQLARDFLRLGAAAARARAEFAQMHEFRLLVKRYRYTLEILGGSKQRMEMLRRLQERLGAVNDCVTANELVADCGVKGVDLRRIKTAVNRLLARRTEEFRIYWRKQKA
jgi:CHAD domain-containing protein